MCLVIFVVECPATHFTCSNGFQCVNQNVRCDYIRDCIDWSDETVDCVCDTSIEFECASGGCINDTWVCDGEADCSDGSDEAAGLCGYTTETPTTDFSTTEEDTAEISTTVKPGKIV